MTDKTESQQMQLILRAIEADRNDRRGMRRLIVICATICLVCLLAIGGLFIAFASGLEITTTETVETTTQEATGDGDIQFNNVSGDQSITEGAGE